MTTKKSTEQPLHPEMPPTDEELAGHADLGDPMRRCTGSARFGIEPHEAPIGTFPKQPSRKDGLGTMCAEHWKAYVKGLTADRKARTTATPELVADAKPAKPKAAPSKPKTTTRKSRAAKPAANADAIVEAEAIIAEVDALPADQHVTRVGDADVQRAFETVAAARGISME